MMMGYRSEVAYAVRLSRNHEHDEQLMAQLKANDIDLDDLWGMFIADIKVNCELAISYKQIRVDHKQRWLAFRECGLKWYADFDDVQAHERILDTAVEYNRRYVDDYNLPELFDMTFVRIGEEIDDVEQRNSGEGYDMFYPVTVMEGAFMSECKGETL